jgi:peptidoglycan hydrolase-like protein with peptidoglycan-binding domain
MNIHHLRTRVPALAVTVMAAGLLATAVPAGAATSSHAAKTTPAAAARSASSGTCTRYDFWYGTTGHCVADIQQMLNDQVWLGWLTGYRGSYISVSGWFGPNTNGQVRNLQSHYRLGVDGVVGPITWGVLCRGAYAANDVSSWYNAGC